MAFDFDAIADAEAARYVGLGPPAGLTRGIQSSSADVPQAIPSVSLPRVIVFIDQGRYDTGGGTRKGAHGLVVRFYMRKLTPRGDIEQAATELRKWLGVLVDVPQRTGITLGGLVTDSLLAGYRTAVLGYGGQRYAGIELDKNVITTEAWLATA